MEEYKLREVSSSKKYVKGYTLITNEGFTLKVLRQLDKKDKIGRYSRFLAKFETGDPFEISGSHLSTKSIQHPNPPDISLTETIKT